MLRVSQVVFLAIVILPLGAGLVYSLLYSLGLAGISNSGFTLEHWILVFRQNPFWKSLAFSGMQAAVGVVFTILLSLFIYVKLFVGERKKLPVYLFFPLIIAPVVLAFAFFAFWSNSGFLARLFYQVGFITSPLQFPDVINSSTGVGILLAHLFLGVPFFIISFSNLYKTHNISELITLSESLGSSKNQAMLKVLIPILIRQTREQMILYFVFFFGAYEIPLLLGSESNRMFSLLIMDKLTKFDITQKPQAFVMTIFYLTSMIALLSFTIKSKSKSI